MSRERRLEHSFWQAPFYGRERPCHPGDWVRTPRRRVCGASDVRWSRRWSATWLLVSSCRPSRPAMLPIVISCSYSPISASSCCSSRLAWDQSARASPQSWATAVGRSASHGRCCSLVGRRRCRGGPRVEGRADTRLVRRPLFQCCRCERHAKPVAGYERGYEACAARLGCHPGHDGCCSGRLGARRSRLEGPPVWLSLMATLAFVVVAVAAAWLFPYILRRVEDQPDLFLLFSIAAGLSLAAVGDRVFGIPLASWLPSSAGWRSVRDQSQPPRETVCFLSATCSRSCSSSRSEA